MVSWESDGGKKTQVKEFQTVIYALEMIKKKKKKVM